MKEFKKNQSVVVLLAPVQADSPISRHTRSPTQTRKRGCSTLGLLPPGPHPFRWFGLRKNPFGLSLSCNHPPRREFISAHQAGVTCLEIYPAVADLCIQPVSEQGTAGTLILPTTFQIKQNVIFELGSLLLQVCNHITHGTNLSCTLISTICTNSFFFETRIFHNF